MRNSTKGKIFKTSAVVLDVSVPLAATLTQFPAWVERSSDATVSGIFLLMAFFSVLPFLKQLKAYFKSPSVWVVWSLIFALFICLRNIIDEMLIVSFWGMCANIIGAGVYKIGASIEAKGDE